MAKIEITKDRRGRPVFRGGSQSPISRPSLAFTDEENNRLLTERLLKGVNGSIAKIDLLLKFYGVKDFSSLALALALDFVKGFGPSASRRQQGAPTKRDPVQIAALELLIKSVHPQLSGAQTRTLIALFLEPKFRKSRKEPLVPKASERVKMKKLTKQIANILPSGRKLLVTPETGSKE